MDAEARKHFKNKVYKTVVPRNVRLSEAPSHGMPCLIYDKNCSEANRILVWPKNLLIKAINQWVAQHERSPKKGLGRGLSALFGDIEKKSESNQTTRQ